MLKKRKNTNMRLRFSSRKPLGLLTISNVRRRTLMGCLRIRSKLCAKTSKLLPRLRTSRTQRITSAGIKKDELPINKPDQCL